MRIRENDDGTFVIETEAGLAHTAGAEIFITRDRALAEESLAYLVAGILTRRAGSHRVKSIFGLDA